MEKASGKRCQMLASDDSQAELLPPAVKGRLGDCPICKIDAKAWASWHNQPPGMYLDLRVEKLSQVENCVIWKILDPGSVRC